jgi:DNA-binding MarR family transcriptional regulator/GNAT superfamily N-acetyltransferase
MTFQLFDGAQAAAHAGELHEVHAEVYAGPPYRRDDDAGGFAHRFRVQRRQPGFVLAEARTGGYLVGYATGMPLRPSTSWWRGLTTPLPEDVTAEPPGRTFALTELLVRASWRRQGIGRALHDLVLSNRPEERATLTVLPAATPAQSAFQTWGWRKIARTRDPQQGSPVADVLLIELPANRALPGRRRPNYLDVSYCSRIDITTDRDKLAAEAHRADLEKAVIHALRTVMIRSATFSLQVAEHTGLHPTDLYCLGLLQLNGPMSAGALARSTGLTTSAITAVIDRLERSGFAARRPDPADRRRVIVVLDEEQNEARLLSLYAAKGAGKAGVLARFGDADLTVVRDFLQALEEAETAGD